jgi:hypothetical protein
MHNKKVLSEIDLGKYKKPNPYKDDIILSNEGQWKYPGEVTRIPSNEITMDDVPYMVWAQPNVGPGIMMEPGEDYYFDNADYVDEYPQIAKQGGALKKNNTSRSIKATNKLFAQNYLFKKPGKKKIFDPNSNFYQEGGEFVEMELDDEDIELFRQGGYIVEDISVPELTQAQKGIVISDPKEYDYRKQMYDDSLTLYNRGISDKKWLNSQIPIKKYSNGEHIYKGTEWNKLVYKKNKKFENAWDRLKKINKKDPKGKLTHLSVSHIINGKDDPTPMNSSHTYFTNYKKPVQPVYLKNSDVDLLPLKKLEAKEHNEIIESKTKQVKPSDYKTAYRDQTIVSYDPTIKQFIQTGSRKAPLPYSEKIGTKDWELNTSQEIPESGPLVWQVNGKDYYNQEEAKKAQAFMPQGSYNFETGGEADDYMDIELTDDEIQQYAKGGYIIEELPEAQEGKETGVESYTSWENAPEEYAPYVTNLKEANVVAEAAPWAKLSNEYEKKNSKEAFIESKKRDYLKKSNKGLNKMAGLSMDNFPKDVAINFANEYEYKKNNYVTKKLGKQKGFNPRKRDEWVEELSPGERKVVANSKYGNKLQPGYWNKALAGVQELGNTLLPGQPFQYKIPGLTKSEQKEMRDSSVSAVDILAPMDIPGAVVANYLKNTGLSTGSNYAEQPAIYSGQKMGNVDDTEAMALNPLNYVGLQEIPLLGYKGIKGAIKGAKALPGAIKASKESGLLSKAYKINPLAVKENPNVLLHRVQKPGQTEEYIMKQYGKENLPGWARAFSSDISDMGYYTYPSVMKSRGYEGAPEILRLKLPKKDIDKYNIYNFNANQKSQGLNPYAFGSNKPKDEFVLPIQDIIKAEKFGLEDIDNLYKEHKEFNTPHWLHGYKENGGSTNEIIETELTPEEIEWYKSQGYEIEELD